MRTLQTVMAGLGLVVLVGCQSSPPPPRAPIPAPGEGPVVRHRLPKPLPADAYGSSVASGGPVFEDVTLYEQELPQEPRYIAAYSAVGSPSMAVYVNRSFDGRIIPATLPEWRQNERYESGVYVGPRTGGGYEGGREYGAYERVDPADRRPETDLHDRRQDELGSTALDLALIETILADRLAVDGVRLQSPAATRSQLSVAARNRLEQGDMSALGEVAERLDADILIHVAARPTLQNREGPSYRILTEAIDTRSGQSLGRAVVDTPPLLDKQTVNRYTAYLAAKLMDDLTASWSRLQRDADRRGGTGDGG